MKDATPPEPPQPLPPRWTPTLDAQDVQVPGLDTTAPVPEQIEQIEQLITIKLQNLDENFAAIHHIITTRLLPAIKRYSVASEPIREAARFWISFFQASAQVRMRMDGDLSTPNHSNDRTITASHTDTEAEARGEEETEGDAGESFRTAQNDLSFQPPPTSSTPLLSRSQLGAGPANPTPESSWAASMESPFSRLDKQISNLHLGDTPAGAAAPAPAKPPAPPSQAKSRMSLPRLKPRTPGSYKPRLPPAVEFKDTSESSGPSFSPPVHVTPMILRPPPAAPDTTASTSTTNSSVFFDRPVFHPRSTERNKGKGKATPLRENIFRRNLMLSAAAPPQSSPRRPAPSPKKNPWSAQKQWNGIVDLREAQPAVYDTSDDEEEDALPAGMSPPVTMRFTRPSDVRLSRAPAPVAAQRVSQGLIAETSRRSLGRGARPSMGVSGMLRPPPGQGTPGRRRAKKDSIEGSMVDAAATSESSAGPSFSDAPHTPGLQGYANYGALFGGAVREADDGDADESDSEDSFWMESEAAGVQMHPSNAEFDDDDDSAEFDFVGGVPVTPPAFQPMDSSFDHDDDDGGGGEATDTIFGARHVAARPSEGPLQIHGTELLRETLDPATSEEAMPSVEQSPTPWAGRRPDYSFDVPR